MNAASRHPTPDDPDFLFYTKIKDSCPDLNDATARALGAMWEAERKLIIDRMFQLSERSVGSSLHIDARPAAIQELANLNLWLIERIIEWKFNHATSGTLDPQKKLTAFETELARQRIETTAATLAERIWSITVARLRKRWPLVASASVGVVSSRLIKDPAKRAPCVRRNHYSPVSCNRLWAGRDGMVFAYRRNVAGGITCTTVSYRQWGAEEFLYSRGLETYLGLVDDDGACSQRKLLATQPLTALDKRRWIAFLVIQYFRTPSLLKTMTERLRRVVPIVSPEYPTNIKSLKAAYETLFRNNAVYKSAHRVMAPRRWTILRAPAGACFIRADNPVTIEGSLSNGTWRMIYPMSPSVVFQIGPEIGAGYEVDFVPTKAISSMECEAFNERLAASAMNSVIASPLSDDTRLRELLARHMGTRSCANASHRDRLWGPLT